MNCTLWYAYDKEKDAYVYNHIEIGGWNQDRVPSPSLDKSGKPFKNHLKFKNQKWLKDFALLKNGKVIYND